MLGYGALIPSMICRGWLVDIETYIIAVRREHRATVPKDWLAQLGQTRGLQVLSSDGRRARVRASSEAIHSVHSRWGDLFHIEKQIWHVPLGA